MGLNGLGDEMEQILTQSRASIRLIIFMTNVRNQSSSEITNLLFLHLLQD